MIFGKIKTINNSISCTKFLYFYWSQVHNIDICEKNTEKTMVLLIFWVRTFFGILTESRRIHNNWRTDKILHWYEFMIFVRKKIINWKNNEKFYYCNVTPLVAFPTKNRDTTTWWSEYSIIWLINSIILKKRCEKKSLLSI